MRCKRNRNDTEDESRRCNKSFQDADDECREARTYGSSEDAEDGELEQILRTYEVLRIPEMSVGELE